MGLFSKKEKIPELPSSKELPPLPEPPKSQKTHELPAFPSHIKEDINQEMVKSAVDNPEGEKEVEVEELPKDFNFGQDHRRTREISPSIEIKKATKENEPIFVRIDKFQKAQKDFEQIKKKIKEIDSVLNKIKDVKSKEDDEIASWSSDLEMIKSRLNKIDENIFGKI